MSGAREEMLGRIRRALADRPAPVTVPRDYRRTGDLSRAELLDLLETRLVDYKALVRRCTPDELHGTIAAALTDRLAATPGPVGSGPAASGLAGSGPAGSGPAGSGGGDPAEGGSGAAGPGVGAGGRFVVPGGLEWVVPGAVQDSGLSAVELDRLDGVVTACAVAVAETGTIVLDAAPDQGRRAITLVPDYHLCVVRAEQVVQTVPEAVARLDPTRPLTWISGPSATSDIELHRVEGVHGPRTLEVVLVG